MTTIAGVDGGGTRTRVVAADLETGRLAFVQYPGTNPRTTDAKEAAILIASGVRQALNQLAHSAGLGEPSGPAAVCAALAGVGRPDAARRMRALLESALSSSRVEVVTDAAAALAAHAGSGAGAVLLVGTGSIALAQDGEGSQWRVGGYGHLAGDEGSGFWVGRAGLAAALRAFDGRGPGTGLKAAALAAFRVAEPMELVDVLYASETPVRDIASFAAAVVDLRTTDPVAGRIVEEALAEHALLVEAVWGAAPAALLRRVAVTGGFYRARPELVAGLARHLHGATVDWLDAAPGLGALRLVARQDAGWSEAVERWWDTWKTAGRNWV